MKPDEDRPANDETKRASTIAHNRDCDRPPTSPCLDRRRKAGTSGPHRRNRRRARQLIDRIVNEAACPVIAVTDAKDQTFVGEASKRGVFACIDDTDATDAENYQSAIDVALRRFAEYHTLDGAFKRRAAIERAKGIWMERHGIGEHAAFAMLRHQSHISNRKIVELASAVIDGHLLLRTLPKDPTQS